MIVIVPPTLHRRRLPLGSPVTRERHLVLHAAQQRHMDLQARLYWQRVVQKGS